MTKSSDSVDQPLVSVVIPTYNRSKELSRAIKSVLSQTYQNFEILVVDDGSEEDLRIVCDSFNDNRIRFYRNEQHTNANVARNRGIKESKGEYIAMLDSDDEYMPHHLQRRIEKIKEWGCDGIFGSAILRHETGEKVWFSRPFDKSNEKIEDYILGTGGATTPSHFYKKNTVENILWDETLNRHQDYDFTIRFSHKYLFISDYKPTTIINWELQKRKFIDLSSCKIFLNKFINNISPKILIKYLLEQYSIALYQNDMKHRKYYYDLLKKNIVYLTYIDWVTVQNPISYFQKIKSFFLYIYLITASFFVKNNC